MQDLNSKASSRFSAPRLSAVDPPIPTGPEELYNGIAGLEEAYQYFAGSLSLADTFRLVASRLSGSLRTQSIELYILDPSRTFLEPVHSDGAELPTAGTPGHVWRAYEQSAVVRSDRFAAIPLFHASNVYGVMSICLIDDTADIESFEAIGERVSPLILAGLAFDRNRTVAMTDALTDLPNERAFATALEDHIAEMASDADRSFSVVAIDLKDFETLNSSYGHATGDRILQHVSRTLQTNIRQMDFLARSRGDEFLLLMPTAFEDISGDIMFRLQQRVAAVRIDLTDSRHSKVILNFGIAHFGIDGDQAEELVAAARTKKQQTRADSPRKVIFFPRELTN